MLLPELDRWCEGRRAAARAYAEAGLGEHVRLPAVPADADPAWHLYVVTHPRADELRACSSGRASQARGYYRTPLHRQPAMAQYAAAGELPGTEELARTNLALPMSPCSATAEVAGLAARGGCLPSGLR